MRRNTLDRDKFHKEIAGLLEPLTRKQHVEFAWRYGLRALLILTAQGSLDFWEENKQRHLISVFRALDTAAAIDTHKGGIGILITDNAAAAAAYAAVLDGGEKIGHPSPFTKNCSSPVLANCGCPRFVRRKAIWHANQCRSNMDVNWCRISLVFSVMVRAFSLPLRR